jgi:hypothetical protein
MASMFSNPLVEGALAGAAGHAANQAINGGGITFDVMNYGFAAAVGTGSYYVASYLSQTFQSNLPNNALLVAAGVAGYFFSYTMLSNMNSTTSSSSS